jgi:hypothetical protein
MKEKCHVSTKLARGLLDEKRSMRIAQVEPPHMCGTYECRCRISRAAAKPSLRRDVLFDAQLERRLYRIEVERLRECDNRSYGKVVLGSYIGSFHIAYSHQFTAVRYGPFGAGRRATQVYDIVEHERMHNRNGIVVAVVATRSDCEVQVHLRRSDELCPASRTELVALLQRNGIGSYVGRFYHVPIIGKTVIANVTKQ